MTKLKDLENARKHDTDNINSTELDVLIKKCNEVGEEYALEGEH